MGHYVVVVAENSKGLSLHEFVEELGQDPMGQYIQYGEEDALLKKWDMFPWQGKTYFALISGPRVDYVGVYDFSDAPWVIARLKKYGIEPAIPRITFCKLMLAVEKVAGGPIYTGEDMGHFNTTREAAECEKPYELPSKLDAFVPDWREKADLPLEKPVLIW